MQILRSQAATPSNREVLRGVSPVIIGLEEVCIKRGEKLRAVYLPYFPDAFLSPSKMHAVSLIFVAFATAALARGIERRQNQGRDHILEYPCTGNTRYARNQDNPGDMSGKSTLEHTIGEPVIDSLYRNLHKHVLRFDSSYRGY